MSRSQGNATFVKREIDLSYKATDLFLVFKNAGVKVWQEKFWEREIQLVEGRGFPRKKK